MMRWSNDILSSTPHRVGLDPKYNRKTVSDRHSIAFFCNPNKSVIIKAFPNTFSDKNPPKYAPISLMDYLTGRLRSTIEEAGEQISHKKAPQLRDSL